MREQLPIFIMALALCTVGGCARMGENSHEYGVEKTRTDESRFPVAQDLAILLPIDEYDMITGQLRTETGDRLLPRDWLEALDGAYQQTDVGDAFSRETYVDDWRLVSLRVAPCSPLGQHLGQAPSEACWPEVRLVWQPVMNDFHIGWIRVPAYADDRAIHSLYHVWPSADGHAARTSLSLVSAALKAGRRYRDLPQALRAAFEQHRRNALDTLLGYTYGLRDPSLPRDTWDQLDIRAETSSEPAISRAFFDRLRDFLVSLTQPGFAHTVTSFSLPEGREPATIDLWVFLAFEVANGQLKQRSLPVFDSQTGALVADPGMFETVAAAAGDDVFRELAAVDGTIASAIGKSIVVEASDRQRLAATINDPSLTLVSNTSCASCHSFNELPFNFHNLSYLQDMEMNIAPRVHADVAYDLAWLRRLQN